MIPDYTAQTIETKDSLIVLNIVFHRYAETPMNRSVGARSTSHVIDTKRLNNVLNSVIHNCVYWRHR